MAKANKEIPHRLTRITLLMDTTKTRPLPAIRPICRHQSIRHLRSLGEELSYVTMTASGDGAVTLAAEASHHDKKQAEMADPSKGNNLGMTMTCTAATTRMSIALRDAAMTKGKAPTAHDDDLAPRRAEGSRCSCRDPSQDVESKRCDPSPSPPSSPYGGGDGGGGPARSRGS
jgi:hypothetical protein